MAIDLGHLAAQGRAFSPARPWTPEELDSLLALERERGLGRQAAADFIRNGIHTVEDYDTAQKADFKPKTLGQATAEAEASLMNHGKSVTKAKAKSKKK